jgi:histidinol-phosphate aminotransferase
VVFICNPNNPTGTIVSARDLDAFVMQAPARVLVVIDEAYFELVNSPDHPASLRYVREGRKNVIVLPTFSMVYGIAGIRLGYGIGEPEALNPLWTVSDCANKAPRHSDRYAGMPAVADATLSEKDKKVSRRATSRRSEVFSPCSNMER